MTSKIETELKSTPSEEATLSSKGYKLLKFLGEGAYAKVFLTEYVNDQDRSKKFILACKIIETAKAPRDFIVKFLPREIDVLIRLNHPHLIHVHSIFQRRSKYYIFMRYGENGDLLAYILKNGCISENQSRVWTRQLALGLQYLHELEIAHRDMKCENIILTSNYNVKISDFGFARYCLDEEDTPVLSETYCGSMSYAAPEILRGKPYEPKPTDVWSLGVVLFVMLNKAMPFDDTRMRKLYEQQIARKYKFRARTASTISLECKSCIKHILEPNPPARHTAEKILKSEWIAMDPRLTTMNIIEATALNRAKEDHKRMLSNQIKGIKSGELFKNRSIDERKGTQPEELHLSSSEENTLETRGYKILRKLNEGSYAKVYLASYKNPSKPEKVSSLACKVIDTKTAPKDFVVKFLPREIEMLIKLDHPHLVHTHSIFQRRHKYFIFMRYMERGDMLDFVLQQGAVLEDQARIWTRQLALAIQYMHEFDLAHRDIKCENVLITLNLNVKLSDFGFCRVCVDDKMHAVTSSTFCGSLSYTAPEILQGTPYSPKPTDVWSLGIVVYVMLNRAMPFEDKQVKQLFRAQMSRSWRFRARYADILSEPCKNIVTQMLEPNSHVRILIDNVINSDWIAMDPRLVVSTPEESRALKKAKEDRISRLKAAESSAITEQGVPAK